MTKEEFTQVCEGCQAIFGSTYSQRQLDYLWSSLHFVSREDLKKAFDDLALRSKRLPYAEVVKAMFQDKITAKYASDKQSRIRALDESPYQCAKCLNTGVIQATRIGGPHYEVYVFGCNACSSCQTRGFNYPYWSKDVEALYEPCDYKTKPITFDF